MLIQNGALPERAIAIRAGEWFLVSVYAQMLGEVALLPKTLATIDASERSRV